MASAHGDSPFARYLALVGAICVTGAAMIFAWGVGWPAPARDHFAALPLNDDGSWYRDFAFGGWFAPEIQDLDLFYHNIGRFEDLVVRLANSIGFQPPSGWMLYRSVHDGSAYLDLRPCYGAVDNPMMRFDRDQDCHTNPETIDSGRDYLTDIGGDAILILVPHSQYCPQQARELAQALGVEAILAADTRYTSVDDGGHFDRKSAVAYTEFLLAALERAKPFKKLLARSSRPHS